MIYLKFYGILFLLFLICFEKFEGGKKETWKIKAVPKSDSISSAPAERKSQRNIEGNSSNSSFKAIVMSSPPQVPKEGRLVENSDGVKQSVQPKKLDDYMSYRPPQQRSRLIGSEIPLKAQHGNKNPTNSENTLNTSTGGRYIPPHARNNQLLKQTKDEELPIIKYGLNSDAEEYVPARSKFMSEQKIPPTISHHENEDNKNATAKTSKIWNPKNTLEQNMEVVPIQQNLNDQENDLNNKGNPLPIVQLFSSNFDLNPILSKKQTGDSFFSPQHPINSGISPVEQYGGPNFGYKPSQNLHMGGANYNNQHHAQPTVHNPRVRYNERKPFNNMRKPLIVN